MEKKALVDDKKVEICGTLSHYLLGSPRLTIALADGQPLISPTVLKDTPGSAPTALTVKEDANSRTRLFSSLSERIKNLPTTTDAQKQTQANLAESVREIRNASNDQTQNEWKQFNKAMLLGLHSECFRDPEGVHRDRVIDADQRTRWSWFTWSLGVFLVLGLWVDLNGTSLHRFYRNRLASAFLEPKGTVHPDLLLSEMNTTAHGAPYHLINASLNRFDSRFGNLIEGFHDDDPDQDPDRRSTRNFLFSQLYCGSELTGFCPTDRYENAAKDYLTVADAIALSGAAVEPVQFDFAPLAWMMTALNLRLGQWLANPRFSRPRWYVKHLGARVINLLFDAPRPIERRDFCFVSDGGFTENLGIVSLLKRRCELIVALDAGCDPEHKFADLARVVRYARLKEGIRITRLFSDQTSSCQPAIVPEGQNEEFDTTALVLDERGLCKEHFLVARITYPPRLAEDGFVSSQRGLLIYIKPSLTGDESVDLLQYRGQDDAFPHNTTADQLYNDVRVECYRQLGFHLGERICHFLFANGASAVELQVEHIEENLRQKAPERSAVTRHRIASSLETLAAATGAFDCDVAHARSEYRMLRVQVQNSSRSLPVQSAANNPGDDFGARIAEALRGLQSFAEGIYEKHLDHANDDSAEPTEIPQDGIAEVMGTVAEKIREIANQFGKSSADESTRVSEAIGRLADAWQSVAETIRLQTAKTRKPEDVHDK